MTDGNEALTLKDVSISDIEKAIGASLGELIGDDEPCQVKVESIQFSGNSQASINLKVLRDIWKTPPTNHLTKLKAE
ncbi:MAG: hypothetical protein AAFZ80_04755 [Cyanobacteria bacterium P01_A01_bin.105]